MVGIVHAGRNCFRVVYAQKMKRYRQQTAGECCFRFFDLQKIAKRGDEKNLARFFLPKIANPFFFSESNLPQMGSLQTLHAPETSSKAMFRSRERSQLPQNRKTSGRKKISSFHFWPNDEDTSLGPSAFCPKNGKPRPNEGSSHPAHKNKNDASTGRMGPNETNKRNKQKNDARPDESSYGQTQTQSGKLRPYI